MIILVKIKRSCNLSKIILKSCFLDNKIDIKFFLMSITCSILLRMRNLSKVIFNMNFFIPCAFEVKEFVMYDYSSPTSWQVKNIPLFSKKLTYSFTVNLSLFRIIFAKACLCNHWFDIQLCYTKNVFH